MKLWLCILDAYNHNFLLETSLLWQSQLLLCLHCQIWTVYGIIRQYLPCSRWYVFLGFVLGFFLLLFYSKSSMSVLDFSAPKWWMFFASVWFPKTSRLWLLTKSLLRTLFNCSHLCCHFAFASWHALHLCSACCSYLLDHPSYSLWWFHTSLPEGTNFWYFHGIFVGYVETPRWERLQICSAFKKPLAP